MSVTTHLRAVAFIAIAALAGCTQPEGPAAEQAQEQGVHVENLTIQTARGPVQFEVEMAVTEAERNRGLMFRREMAANHGMLFDFDPPEPVSFWMRNTHISLDLIFIGPDGRIINIAERATPYSDAPIPSAGPVRGVLEINGGLARQHGIAPGDRVQHRIFPRT